MYMKNVEHTLNKSRHVMYLNNVKHLYQNVHGVYEKCKLCVKKI